MHFRDMLDLGVPQSDDLPVSVVSEEDPLTLPCHQFVNWFARINSFKSESTHATRPLVAKSNSRQTPSLFILFCGIGFCAYSSRVAVDLQRRQLDCNRIQPERTVLCREPGCTSTFSNEANAESHFAKEHDFTPKPCPQCPDDDVIYHTYQDLRTHRWHVHDIFGEPISFPLGDEPICGTGDSLFARRGKLRGHLHLAHSRRKVKYALRCVLSTAIYICMQNLLEYR